MTRDPIMHGAVFGPEGDWGWLRTLILLEGAFQVPCFALGALGLWHSEPSPSSPAFNRANIQTTPVYGVSPPLLLESVAPRY